MPYRVLHSLGQIADIGIFGAALAVIAGRLVGMDVSDAGALLTGLAALLIATGRTVKYFADARLTIAEAKVKETFTQPEVYKLLTSLKCWNAPDCINRIIMKPEVK
ncbi:MAG: hypothetical protein HGB35_01000 [Geobacteraceae bacterium]|jgi:hypothetical protein|nr:hypothetical protein [Geobacteraceae bacterium]